MSTLSLGGTTLTLPDELYWQDEYAWRPVQERRAYSITGALIIDIGVRQAGRPITLAGDEKRGWLSRAALDQLRAWAALPTDVFTLVLRGTTYAVRLDGDAAIQAQPIFYSTEEQATDDYVVTLRFITV